LQMIMWRNPKKQIFLQLQPLLFYSHSLVWTWTHLVCILSSYYTVQFMR
jgi:hypothetical protein